MEESGPQSRAGEENQENISAGGHKYSTQRRKRREAGEEEEDPFEEPEELPDLEGAEGKKDRKKKNRAAEKKKQTKTGISPGRLLGIAIVFFVLAAGLWGCTWLIRFTEEELFAARAGILGCLILAVLAAVGGVVLSWKNGRRELQEEQERLEKERKNAMVPTRE